MTDPSTRAPDTMDGSNDGPWNDEAHCARRRCRHPQSWHEHNGVCDEDTCACGNFMDPAAHHDNTTEHDQQPDEHIPWHYTEHGVVCTCGQPMRDEICPASSTATEHDQQSRPVVSSGSRVEVETEHGPHESVDLMVRLRASVEAAKKRRTDSRVGLDPAADSAAVPAAAAFEVEWYDDPEDAGGHARKALAAGAPDALIAELVRTEGDLAVAVREASRARAALRDLAEHGLHADLQPTVHFGDESHVYRQLTDYLRRLDEGVRERARTALGGVS